MDRNADLSSGLSWVQFNAELGWMGWDWLFFCVLEWVEPMIDVGFSVYCSIHIYWFETGLVTECNVYLY